jgi:uncharacterized protein DUF3592
MIIGIIFASVGAGMVTWSVLTLVESVGSHRWQTTEGVIIASRVHEEPGVEGLTYRPKVLYRYSVNGSEHVASRTKFGDGVSLSWSSPARQIVRTYPVGTAVTVHYNPADPADAVLEPGVNGWILSEIAFGVMFALVGLFSVFG